MPSAAPVANAYFIPFLQLLSCVEDNALLLLVFITTAAAAIFMAVVVSTAVHVISHIHDWQHQQAFTVGCSKGASLQL